VIKVPDPVPRRRRGRLGIVSKFPSGFEAMEVNRSHSFAVSSVKYLGLARQVNKMLEILSQKEHDRHLLGVNSSIDACLFLSLTPSKVFSVSLLGDLLGVSCISCLFPLTPSKVFSVSLWAELLGFSFFLLLPIAAVFPFPFFPISLAKQGDREI
jgi:hypothetical protein